MMHKLPEFPAFGNGQMISRIDRTSVRLLWSSSFWDGAQSGVLVYRDERCWFQVIEENPGDEWYRRFAIVRLTDEQLREECYWHDLFREKVGTHTDYDADGKRSAGELRPKEKSHEFYNAYKGVQPWDLSDSAVLGWFEV